MSRSEHVSSQLRKVQEKFCLIYRKLAEAVSPTFGETFETVAQFSELRANIVSQYG